MKFVIHFLYSAGAWIFSCITQQFFSALEIYAVCQEKNYISQLLSCLLHCSFQPVQGTSQELVAQDCWVPSCIPNWWAFLATIIHCNKTQAITSFRNTLASVRCKIPVRSSFRFSRDSVTDMVAAAKWRSSVLVVQNLICTFFYGLCLLQKQRLVPASCSMYSHRNGTKHRAVLVIDAFVQVCLYEDWLKL